MVQAKPSVVIGEGQHRGTIEAPPQWPTEDVSRVLVRLEDGRRVVVPANLLVARDDGTYYLPLTLDELDTQSATGGDRSEDTLVRPVVAEELAVGKRQVDAGGVRVSTVVHEREEVVDEPLWADEIEVERVPVHRVIEKPVEIRSEGETVIVPVLEEVLVVEKRLMLKEEIRVTRRRREKHEPQRVTLRSEEARIERIQDRESLEGGDVGFTK
jgi:uncharacterized protein (TIGR02271 family)